MDNDYIVQLISRLDGSKTIGDLNKIEQELNKKGINLKTSLDTATTKQELHNLAKQLQSILKTVGIDIDTSKITSAFNQITRQMQNASKVVDSLKVNDTITKLNEQLRKNSAYSSDAKKQIKSWIDELETTDVAELRLKEINSQAKQLHSNMANAGKIGKSFTQTIKDGAKSFLEWTTASGAVMEVVTIFRRAITELKEINTLTTEISKANDSLSTSQLAEISDNSFDVASKYGKKATNYLSAVQESSRAGYDNAEAIAELSTAIQGAGDVTSDIANKYVIATDKAYGLKGSVEELTKVFDGSNYITNKNAVNMTELAEGMSIVGSTAASFGLEANQTTAALGTMVATTQQSGSEMARAFRAILLNIRQVSDEEEGINTEGLTKYEKACDALGVSLKETRNGVLQTRDAMEVLKELSVEYNQLEAGDLRRTELLNSVGGKLRANALDAILKNFDMYETMLQQYEEGTGSMAREAEKTANSWEGSLNRLSNTWTDTIENIANSESIINTLNFFNGLLNVVNEITSVLGGLGTIGLGAGLFAGIKNFGRPKMFGLCFEIAEYHKCSLGY